MEATPQGEPKIDFMSRAIPNSLYINITTGQIKIGDPYVRFADLEVSHTTIPTRAGSVELLKFLSSLSDRTINKVILDNTTEFRLASFEEFIGSLKEHLENKET